VADACVVIPVVDNELIRRIPSLQAVVWHLLVDPALKAMQTKWESVIDARRGANSSHSSRISSKTS